MRATNEGHETERTVTHGHLSGYAAGSAKPAGQRATPRYILKAGGAALHALHGLGRRHPSAGRERALNPRPFPTSPRTASLGP